MVAGRIRLGNPPSHIGPVRPVNGSSAHLKPTYWIRIRPMKNTGIETPATEQAMMMRSAMRPRLTAASVPNASPLGTAISIAPSISSTVGPIVIASSSLTIRFEMIERPRSPRRTRMMYSKNCTAIERSRPSSQPDRRDGLGLGVGTGDDHRGISRHHLQQTKTEEENPEQGGERNQQTMDNLLCHATPTDHEANGQARPLARTFCSASACANVLQSPPWQRRFVRRARALIIRRYWHAPRAASRPFCRTVSACAPLSRTGIMPCRGICARRSHYEGRHNQRAVSPSSR